MPDPAIPGIQACVFDAYGTLFDVHSAAAKCRTDLGDKADTLSDIWRQKQLQYTWLRSLMGTHADFWQVTGDALDFALAAVGLDDQAMRQRLMDLYLRLDAYPEVPAMLARLKAGGIATAILSNGAPAMLDAAVESAGLADSLDQVLSVEDVGIFKPDPRVYQLAVDRLGVAPREICFQSSNAWDAHAASHFGFRVVWVNRFGQPAERIPGTPDRQLGDLASLPDLVGVT
ncbi:MAG: haloacid dehalogenase type II [Rhodospirillales bacterium]|nr:MAG: haloacid dehalogenase type II [Rhodospirillales bacterium]